MVSIEFKLRKKGVKRGREWGGWVQVGGRKRETVLAVWGDAAESSNASGQTGMGDRAKNKRPP